MGKSFDKVLMGAAGTDGSYEIKQSAIFDTNASLVRTPSSTGNRKKWTISVWVKKGKLGQIQYIYGGQSSNETDLRFSGTDTIEYFGYQGGSHTWGFSTARKFRDVGAWYHIVAIFDSANGTQALRARLFVNGEELPENGATSTVAAVTQNQDSMMNLVNVPQYIGKLDGNDYFFKGNMAEFHFLDGAAKAPTDFAETNSETGQWVPIEYTGGSYGTNGFYLKFKSGAIGTDSSGQGNNHTVANIANADIVTDTPNNNFCTLNPLDSILPALLQGTTNTGLAGDTAWKMARSTFELTTGKWYWEMKWTGNTVNSTNGYQMGLKTPTSTLSAAAERAGSFAFQGVEIFLTAGSVNTVTISPGSALADQNDIIMFAYDADAGKMWIGVNGTWTSSGDPAAGSNNQWASIPTTGVSPFAGVYGANMSVDCNFGQKAYAYTPPSGFKALSTKNLPDPAIPLPALHFNTGLYNGNGGTQTITGVGFSPALVWSKSRGDNEYHVLTDQVRGNTHPIFSNATSAEETRSNGITGFNSDGYALGAWTGNNKNNVAQVSWNWKGNGAGSTDTSGDIDAVVSANPTAGFSIVAWTGNGTAAGTVPHGLGVAPEMVVYKRRSNSGSNWVNWITVIDGGNDILAWNTTGASSSLSNAGGITSSFISNAAFGSEAMLAYCFASKPNYSSIGIFTGNGSNTGPFVNCGFRPSWLLIKLTSASGDHDWFIVDNKRDPDNFLDRLLSPNLNAAEGQADPPLADFLSNGFKIRAASASINGNGATILYMAFAESPFKYANAR